MEPKPTAGSDQMPSRLQLGTVLSHPAPLPQSLDRETVPPGRASKSGLCPHGLQSQLHKSLEPLSHGQKDAPVHAAGHHYPYISSLEEETGVRSMVPLHLPHPQVSKLLSALFP